MLSILRKLILITVRRDIRSWLVTTGPAPMMAATVRLWSLIMLPNTSCKYYCNLFLGCLFQRTDSSGMHDSPRNVETEYENVERQQTAVLQTDIIPKFLQLNPPKNPIRHIHKILRIEPNLPNPNPPQHFLPSHSNLQHKRGHLNPNNPNPRLPIPNPKKTLLLKSTKLPYCWFQANLV